MGLETYDLAWNRRNFAYEFYSEGPRGRIKKQLRFQSMPELNKNAFNVALGDQDEVTGHWDHMTISNNNDRLKVLNTVAEAIVEFIDFRPNAIILVQGSTGSRTRLYQMLLPSLWLGIGLRLEVLGKFENDWLPFQKGVNYEGFLIFKKIE